MVGCHFVLWLSFATFASGVQYFRQPNDLPDVNYDFIIVGGGTAGAVVGSRLGEVEDYKVLVIEAGPSFPVYLTTLALVQALTGTIQININGRVLNYPRARILGGCSSHNDMLYNRGSKDDYDRWAATVGDNSLSWARIYPYILKAEKCNGKIGVTAPYFNHPFNDLLFEATDELSDEFPLLRDVNSGRPIGFGWSQSTIAHGVRSSSATGYLAHATHNVHVLLNSLVIRVLAVDDDESKEFRKIEFTQSPGGPSFNLTAAKEVILSAGVINTPQFLLLSGIGPGDELNSLGIETIVNIPSVGNNFSDQSSFPLFLSTDLPSTDFNRTEALLQWQSDHTGPLALEVHLPQMGWVRFPPDSEPFKDGNVDPTGGPNSPHVEVFFSTISPGSGGNGTLSMNIVDLHPTSRGSITLGSTSPFDQPVIDLSLLASPVDNAILLEGFRSAQRLMTSDAFSKNVFGLSTPPPSDNGTLTDEEFIQYIKKNATHFGHGVGSCSMAPADASWGVVDPKFKVRNVKGLRIIDASVIPFVISGHIQVSVYAIAEWASNVIKRSHETRSAIA